MSERILIPALIVAAVGNGIVGGIFYAFSSFVMPALGRIAPEQGLSAMRMINVTVITPSFLIPFMGMALLSLLLAGWSLLSLDMTASKLMLAAGLLYLLGCFGVTMALNVPLNDRLAASPPTGEAAFWADYLKQWTLWNHVRTAAPLLALALLIGAVRSA